MSNEQIIAEAMELSLPDRVSLAQALWQSIEEGLSDADEGSVAREAVARDQELSSGVVEGRSHEDVMQAARRAIGCD
jgi:putative addiction module component (TIGR02574 family)